MCLLCLTVSSQKLKTVEAEYTYNAPENVSIEQARKTALERAKIQALADAFGTIVSQYNTTVTENSDKHSGIDFASIGSSEVKGEWIETIYEKYSEPVFTVGMVSITCKVKGKAREITSARIDLKAHLLRNGTEDKFESDQFRSGDELYMSFQSPEKGFLTVYLIDKDNQAFCILPYQSQQWGAYPIEANRRYLFFSMDKPQYEEADNIDEYIMTCNGQVEHNQIYYIFSPNQFAKAVDNQTGESLLRKLSFENFNKWLVNCRKLDKDMIVRTIPIIIKK